ncbi:hypothetical protein BG000_006090 [Podila horticola]|nr:hypothetical protein BG000_006090 [Podila horticola]
MSLDGFHSRKKAILIALNSDTPDKSPKGYVDEPLLPLIVLINTHADYVTTSSCSGRICTYLEGLDEGTTENSEEGDNNISNTEEEEEEPKGFDENTSLAAVEASKRAKGGQWLYVSHDPVELPVDQEEGSNNRWIIDTLFGPEAHRVVTMEEQKHAQQIKTLGMARSQLVYFKFEPMILHIEASTPTAAKQFLNHSLFSGYRNSGILPSAKRTMLAIHPIYLMVSLTYLRVLVELSNDKFRANVDQMGRFERRLTEHLVGVNSSAQGGVKQGDQGAWEDKDARRDRKKREGLERAAAAAAERARRAEEEERDEPTPMET